MSIVCRGTVRRGALICRVPVGDRWGRSRLISAYRPATINGQGTPARRTPVIAAAQTRGDGRKCNGRIGGLFMSTENPG